MGGNQQHTIPELMVVMELANLTMRVKDLESEAQCLRNRNTVLEQRLKQLELQGHNDGK
jgi:hypothetical protein